MSKKQEYKILIDMKEVIWSDGYIIVEAHNEKEAYRRVQAMMDGDGWNEEICMEVDDWRRNDSYIEEYKFAENIIGWLDDGSKVYCESDSLFYIKKDGIPKKLITGIKQPA